MNNPTDFQIEGKNAKALFTLKLHRGDGMLLISMNWKKGKPPKEFVGFAIEYKEPDGDRFFVLRNRLAFKGAGDQINSNQLSTRLSPIQKFRWVHFPMNAEKKGLFTYRVTPVFMDAKDQLSYGDPQEAKIQLMRETHPELNVAFTRGYVASQAFCDHFGADKETMKTLLPAKAADGVTFKCTHPKADEALTWMGFESRAVIIDILDQAIKDTTAKVSVVAYDLCEPVIIDRLMKLKNRLKIIIDDEGDHLKKGSGENQAEAILVKSAGAANVKRQHMGQLQHNKMIIVDGKKTIAVGGSTNFSWRGFFVQNNNAIIVNGADAIEPFKNAFQTYWDTKDNSKTAFTKSKSSGPFKFNFKNLNASITFSPHASSNAMLTSIAKDLASTKSSLFYSLAFLYQTKGTIRDTLKKIAKNDKIFSCGMSDKKIGEFSFLKPDGKTAVVNPSALDKKNTPEPFKSEATGGGGTRLHHKFVVIDFDKPTARVYTGSYNFSLAADNNNGENLFLIKDRKVAVSFMIEALRIFDHYQFRIAQQNAKTKKKQLFLAKPPQKAGEKAWWTEDYSNVRKIKDRELFA